MVLRGQLPEPKSASTTTTSNNSSKILIKCWKSAMKKARVNIPQRWPGGKMLREILLSSSCCQDKLRFVGDVPGVRRILSIAGGLIQSRSRPFSPAIKCLFKPEDLWFAQASGLCGSQKTGSAASRTLLRYAPNATSRWSRRLRPEVFP